MTTLTIQNYGKEWGNVKHLLPDYLVDNSEGYLEVASLVDTPEFQEDKELVKDVQDFLDLCNKNLLAKTAKAEEAHESKPKATKKATKTTTKTATKATKKQAKADVKYNLVEDKSPAVKIITRFVGLQGKEVCVATKAKAQQILNALQKYAITKQIRKTNKFANEILAIQDSLLKILALKDGTLELKDFEHYKKIAQSFKPMTSAQLIKAYIGIQGKADVKTKAKELLAKVKECLKANQVSYRAQLKAIENSLQNYLDDNTDTPQINEMELNGLYGVIGTKNKPKSGTIINSHEFLGATFETLNFTGKWRTLIGEPESHFKMMMYGKAGSGKSTLALQFAKYLATLGKKVLYVADEEKYGYTLQEKIKRLNATHSNLSFTDKMPDQKTCNNFDIIFIDSVQSAGFDAEELRKVAPTKSFVYVFQTTKDGKFRGENSYSHDVDTVIRVENMTATTEKNRFGASGTINVI